MNCLDPELSKKIPGLFKSSASILHLPGKDPWGELLEKVQKPLPTALLDILHRGRAGHTIS